MSVLPAILTSVFYQERADGLAARSAFGQQWHHVQKANEVLQIKRIVDIFYLVFLVDIIVAIGLIISIMSFDIFAKDLLLALIMTMSILGGFVVFALALMKRLKSILGSNPILNSTN